MKRRVIILVGIAAIGIAPWVLRYTAKPKFITPVKPEIVFESAHTFSDGLAHVKLNGRVGFIDTRGQWAIPPEFEETALSFSEGLAWARQGKLLGFIDKQGRWVIPPQFKEVKQFSSGLAAVTSHGKRWGYIDKAGKFIIPEIAHGANKFSEGFVMLSIDDKASEKPRFRHALFDKNGNLVFSRKQYQLASEISEGLVRFCIWPVFPKNMINFGDPEGGEPGMPKMNMMGPGMMNPGMMGPGMGGPGMFGGMGTSLPASMPSRFVKWGFIDIKGQVVVKAVFEDVGLFSEGLAMVKINQKWGYIDRTGKMVIRPQWNMAGTFNNGFAWVSQGDGKYGVIDKTGKLISSMQWKNKLEFKGELAHVRSGWKSGFIDRTGNVVISPKFDKLPYEYHEWFSDGPVPVCVGKKWGYIDRTGNYVIESRFDEARYFSDELAGVEMGRVYREKFDFDFLSKMFEFGNDGLFEIVTIDGKYGFIDKTGRVVVEAQFDSVNDFKEGFAVVYSGSACWFIDTAGKPLKVSPPSRLK
jgi:hypothetical protein